MGAVGQVSDHSRRQVVSEHVDVREDGENGRQAAGQEGDGTSSVLFIVERTSPFRGRTDGQGLGSKAAGTA